MNMTKMTLEHAKQRFLQADNSPAGEKAKDDARKDLLDWADTLALFGGLNTGTEPAEACFETAKEIQIFCSEFSTIR